MRCLAALLVLAISPSALADLVTNASFESGTSPRTSTAVTATDSTTISNWTVTSGDVDSIGTYWSAPDGLRSLDMNGLSQCTIEQMLTTVAGRPATYGGESVPNPGRTKCSSIFTASTTSTLLESQRESGDDAWGPALDQVSVLESPEPGAFLLFGAGLGGLALWRRSQSKKTRAPKA